MKAGTVNRRLEAHLNEGSSLTHCRSSGNTVTHDCGRTRNFFAAGEAKVSPCPEGSFDSYNLLEPLLPCTVLPHFVHHRLSAMCHLAVLKNWSQPLHPQRFRGGDGEPDVNSLSLFPISSTSSPRTGGNDVAFNQLADGEPRSLSAALQLVP